MSFEKFSKNELINFIKTLLERVDGLENKVDSLNFKVAELQEENQILKVKKNSSNSSIAPSTDLSKSNQSLRQKSKLNKGGQNGHKGHTLEMSSTPDEITLHVLSFCNSCGLGLSNVAETLLEKRQVIDLPVIKPIYKEHQVFSKTCKCGNACKGNFPINVNAPIQYGESIESLASYFSVRQYMPYQRMQECFSDIFGVNMSK